MEKKYIIKLDENEIAYKTVNSNGCPMIGLLHPAPYTEPDLEQVRKEAYEDGYKTAKVQCNIQAEKDLREVGERHYQKGLSDAWEAARKVVALSTVDRRKVFGSEYMYSILEKHTASECIEKIRAYEQEKEEQITKGDIVLIKSTPEVEILVTYADEEYVSGIALTEVDGNCEIGDQYTNIVIHKVEKTGRHYEIAEVLAKMKEES